MIKGKGIPRRVSVWASKYRDPRVDYFSGIRAFHSVASRENIGGIFFNMPDNTLLICGHQEKIILFRNLLDRPLAVRTSAVHNLFSVQNRSSGTQYHPEYSLFAISFFSKSF